MIHVSQSVSMQIDDFEELKSLNELFDLNSTIISGIWLLLFNYTTLILPHCCLSACIRYISCHLNQSFDQKAVAWFRHYIKMILAWRRTLVKPQEFKSTYRSVPQFFLKLFIFFFCRWRTSPSMLHCCSKSPKTYLLIYIPKHLINCVFLYHSQCQHLINSKIISEKKIGNIEHYTNSFIILLLHCFLMSSFY